MRVRKLLVLGAAAAGLAGLLALTVWPSRCPVALMLMSVAPSGTVEDDETEHWLVALSISNCSAGVLTFAQESMHVEAKVANRWVEARQLSYVDGLARRSEAKVLLVVPVGTDACRLSIKYLPEPLHLRLLSIPPRLGLWRTSWYPALALRVFPVGWLNPLRSDFIGRSPHWKWISPEISFPQRSTGPGGTFDRTHNHRPGVYAGWPLLFAFFHARPRATQAGRSRHPTTARRGRSALGRNDLGDHWVPR